MTVPTPSWLSSAIFYEVYPQSFLDTNGDGIGDLEGIIRKLDYIKSLGVTAVWLNPCFLSPFRDAGYDISDFYQVAPRYGTNADLARLFAEAHARGLKVCLDLVAGHTSDEHPWFQASAQAEPNAYSHWYVWSDSVWDKAPDMVGGYGPRDGNFLSNFFYHQPALNYGYANPDPQRPWQLPVSHPDVQAVRAELFKIMRFWLDLGADGFRVDMAHSLVKGDTDLRETMKLWAEVRAWYDREYPEAVLLSEWSDPSKSILGGFHIDFLLAFGDPPAYTSLLRKEKGRDLNPRAAGGHSYFDKLGRGDIREFLDPWLTHYRATKDHGYIALPSGNHDTPRLNYGRTREEIEAVFAFLFTMPGVPVIYNGDEIGQRQVEGLPSKEGGYSRTGCRTPMQWDDGANAGFSSAAPEDLYLPLDPGADRPTVAAQEADPASLLHAVRALTRLRHAHPALGPDGAFIPLVAESGVYPLVYLRSGGGETFLVAINPAVRPVSTQFTMEGGITAFQHVAGSPVTCEVGAGSWRIELPGISYAIFAARE